MKREGEKKRKKTQREILSGHYLVYLDAVLGPVGFQKSLAMFSVFFGPVALYYRVLMSQPRFLRQQALKLLRRHCVGGSNPPGCYNY